MLDMHCSSCPCSASLPGILHNPSCLFRWGVKSLEELFWDTVPDFWSPDVKYNSLQALSSLSEFCRIPATQINISGVILCPDFSETLPFLSSICCFLMHWQYPIHSCCGRSGVPGHQWKSVNGRWCPLAGPHSLSMNKFYPEEAGSEQKSPCNSVVRDYSEGRELGGRSHHYKTHVIDQSSNLLFRNHQQHLPRCPKYFFFHTG